MERIKFKLLTKPFLTGLITLIPIVLTGYFGYWLFTSIEKIIKAPFLWLLPDDWYRPGVGIVLCLALIYFIGLIMQTWVVKKLFRWLEKTVLKIPLVKHIYQSLRDFFQYFEPSEKKRFGSVVRVDIPGGNGALIAFKTQHDEQVPDSIQIDSTRMLYVYFPMSYNFGGYSAFIPKEWATEIDWSVKDATSYIISAGVAYNKDRKTELS